ncbi:PIG-P-domain-containing protein [Piedraia hortae CBS 480.64]|uniref:PIG-P-domain-containing protein n=1 Tax=Piedraia hortae CBS 480.64 TaxID=1314780 RepID=A0A6A7C5E6_9PEZI|nr:PIG-P-domain-containing protein [Piedraia hortae CBS 480.64]
MSPTLVSQSAPDLHQADSESDESQSESDGNGSEPQGKYYRRSYSHLAPLAFAPPFYNRPPTPLPPSPSLTSLLRPSFTSSRPSTPDPSSDEGIGASFHTPSSATASTLTTLRSSKLIPRASPRVPTYEYYGFTLYLSSSLAFIFYLLWAFLPSPFLHQLGIHYYPNRWWALAIPAWTVMAVIYIYVALAAYNVGRLTLPLKDLQCIVDDAACVAAVDSKGRVVNEAPTSSWKGAKRGKGKDTPKHQGLSAQGKTPDWKTMWNEGTDAVMDIPIGGVCEILYGS